MRVHLIHGIHTDPGSRVEDLAQYLKAEGFDVVYPDYGYELALETRILNPMLEGVLRPYIGAGDVLVGHSNGCAIAYHLMQLGCPAVGAVFINGALERDIARPPTCQWIDIYFNAGDEITLAAQIARKIGIVDPVWGELGHAGYSGSDPRIYSIDCGATSLPKVKGHSDFFSAVNLPVWGPLLAQRIKLHLG